MLNPAQNYATLPPRWMTIRQVKDYCPLGEALILRLLDLGKIKGGKVADDKRGIRFVEDEMGKMV